MFTILRRIFSSRSIRWGVGLLFLVAAVAFGLIVKRDYFSQLAAGESRYSNLLLDVQFTLPPDYHVEDVAKTDLIALVPRDQSTANQSEAAFFAASGLTVKPLRTIPGTRKTFEVFETSEFEPLLRSDGREFTSRPFVTDLGYNAFLLTVTKPFPLTMVVVNSPVAYWLSAAADDEAFQTIYQSLTKPSDDELTQAKRPASSFENFLLALKDRQFDQVSVLGSAEFQSKFPADELRRQVETAALPLSRPFKAVSVRVSDTTAFVRGVLEDEPAQTYAFAGGRLTWEDDRWRVSSFVLDADRPGLPAEAILRHVRTTPKLEE